MLDSGEVSRGEKMLYSGTHPESYTTEYTLVYEENTEICTGNILEISGFGNPRSLSLCQSIWAHQLGGPRLLPAPKLKDFYREGWWSLALTDFSQVDMLGVRYTQHVDVRIVVR